MLKKEMTTNSLSLVIHSDWPHIEVVDWLVTIIGRCPTFIMHRWICSMLKKTNSYG
jgi:hypothetical protein